MFHVVLFEPEIPPNTGNIIRLCANAGAELHLIHPLGFTLEDRQLRRAGLDYHDLAVIREHSSWPAFLQRIQPARVFALSTKGRRCYAEETFSPNDAFLFGPESRGLPSSLLDSFSEPHRLYVPMLPERRSLNLSNAVALVLYEAWRQAGFAGALSSNRHPPNRGLLPDPPRLP